jgi:hypothetical protein
MNHQFADPPGNQVENEQRASIPSKQGTSPEQTSALEESIFKISGLLSTITRNQKYFRTRENRNFSTVRSTERRIFNFSVMESLMMVCMAGLQVFIVRFFFQVCCSSVAAGAKGVSSANCSPLGREKGIRVNDWAIARHCVLWFWWDTGKIWHGGVEILCTFTSPS